MSNYEQYTTDELDNLDRDSPKALRRSKSKGKKSKSKKKTNASSKSPNHSNQDVEIDGPAIRQKQSVNEQRMNSTLPRATFGARSKPQAERQLKLTFASKATSNSSSIGTTVKYAISEFERRKKSLEKQLNEKDALIEKLKNEKEVNINKLNKLKIESQEYKENIKKILQTELRASSRVRREQKAEINPKMGYYKQASWTSFIEGDYIISIRNKIENLESRIEDLQNRKKSSRHEQFERILYQIDYLMKDKSEAMEVLRKREVEISQYKQRLRLADKEANCTLAKSNWPLISNRYLPLELLGSGGFGEVYKCYDLDKTNYVAVKTNCFEPTRCQENRDKFIEHVRRQVDTLKTLNHPNIVKLVDEITINDKISFVLEYCSGPQLSKYLAKREHLDEKQARGIIKQISFALKYMFEQKYRIIHYDLKPANIIFHHGSVKILDFGLCKRMDSEQTKIDLTSQGVGTYWYLPPETFMNDAEISSKVDVWSLGVIFYELLYGKRPFGHGVNQTKIYQEGIILKAQKVQFPSEKKFKVSEEAKEFIKACLKYDPRDRLDPEEVYNHKYLNDSKAQ